MRTTRLPDDQDLQNLLDGAEESEGSERSRRRQRWAYSTIQSMAPCDGYTLPTMSELRPVCCQDLSTTGIGLRLPEKPDFDYVVVTLGDLDSQVHVLARIVHSRPVAEGYVVGCRFIRKVELEM